MKHNILFAGLLVVYLASAAKLLADPMFYLKNKHYSGIFVRIKQNGKLIHPQFNKKRGQDIKLDMLDRTVDTVLEIDFSSCRNMEKCERGEHPSTVKTMTATIAASPKEQKTVYVKFRGGKLMPQLGGLKGATGRTTNLKYSMAKNISAADIEQEITKSRK